MLLRGAYLADCDLFMVLSETFMRCGWTMLDSRFCVSEEEGRSAFSWLSCLRSTPRVPEPAAGSRLCTDPSRP